MRPWDCASAFSRWRLNRQMKTGRKSTIADPESSSVDSVMYRSIVSGEKIPRNSWWSRSAELRILYRVIGSRTSGIAHLLLSGVPPNHTHRFGLILSLEVE